MTELKVLIKNEYDRAVKYRSSKESFAMLYSGQIYTDEYLINNFPIKYKVEERLAQLKSLLFFLASTNNDGSGIASTTMPDASTQKWYDLYGRPVTGEPVSKGIFITGGKKILIK